MTTCLEIAVHLAVACDVYDGVFVLSFFPRDVLDEILNLIESVLRIFLPTLLCQNAADKILKTPYEFWDIYILVGEVLLSKLYYEY